MPKGKKHHGKGKGKKRAGVAAVSTGVGVQPYMPMKFFLPREAHLKAILVILEATNAVLSSLLYANPMLPLVAKLAIFKTTLDSPSVAPKDKAQVTEAGHYFAKWLATVAMLVDKSTPTMAALYDAIPCGEGGRWRRPGKTLLFDIICGLAQRVPLTKLVKLDGDIHPYFVALIVATLVWVGETVVMPKGTQITIMTREAFNSMLLKVTSQNYDDYGLVSR